MEEPAAAEEFAYDTVATTEAGGGAAETPEPDDSVADYTAKIIYTASVSIETTEFDKAVAALRHLKRLIFQGFPTFEFSFLFKVSSQIFSYFLMFFPAILVNSLVKQASLPTGFFNYSLSDILLPLHHQNLHGCKCSRLH